MQLLIFDMDGVLLQPKGYHRALQETVRLVSQALGFEAYQLTNQAIARFEALGISSEWHSSALCMALMVIEAQIRGYVPSLDPILEPPAKTLEKINLDLPLLFDCLEDQPFELPALRRAEAAIGQIATKAKVDPTIATTVIQQSESLDRSLTFNLFQELVLGSQVFEQTYQKPAQLDEVSYLNSFDRSYVQPDIQEKLITWLNHSQNGAAIMTNRPSNTLLGLPGTPEAELGASLVGLDFMPMIGSGEMTWLANLKGEEVGALLKPAPQHALSAILAAAGMSARDALLRAYQIISGENSPDLSHLDGSTIYIFEDTPGGLNAVDNAMAALSAQSIDIQVQKLGVTQNPTKRSSLQATGADVFESLDLALASVNSFDHP